ncbi:MAG: sec-independent protein translocase protein TatA [Lentimonas sp.]|jgi:sec-independent protein translocase protein TatA
MMTTLAFLQNLSSWEIILIFMVVLLFFGAKRLPELSKSLGKSLREFKSATSGIEENIRSAMNEDEPAKKPAATTKPQESVAASKSEESVASSESEDVLATSQLEDVVAAPKSERGNEVADEAVKKA